MLRRPGPQSKFTLLLGLLASACGSTVDTIDTDGSWAGTITTDGNITTVVNESGSVWGGGVELVEILSIGVLEGNPEQMLAQPSATWLTDTEVYIADRQDNHVRVYDFRGNLQRQFGRAGEGPGELNWPRSLVVTDDGRVLVGSVRGAAKVSVFDTAGAHIEDWALGATFPSTLFAVGDRFYTSEGIRSHPGWAFGYTNAFQAIGPSGLEGDAVEVPALGDGVWINTTMAGRAVPLPVPLTPMGSIWTLAPQERLLVGYPNAYRFEVRRLDGTLETIVERFWEPIPVAPEEGEEQRRIIVDTARRFDPEFAWDGAELPTHKAAYEALRVDHDGRVWVKRAGPARPRGDCEERDNAAPRPSALCWIADTIVDVFDLDGSFLGSVVGPEGNGVWPEHVHGDLVAAITQDEDGAPQVKIYRLARHNDAPG